MVVADLANELGEKPAQHVLHPIHFRHLMISEGEVVSSCVSHEGLPALLS